MANPARSRALAALLFASASACTCDGATTKLLTVTVSVEPGVVDFGVVAVGRTEGRDVILRAQGTGLAQISEAAFVGGAGPFAGTVALVEFGMSAPVVARVTYAPDAVGSHRGQWRVTTDAGEFVVELRGRAVATCVDVDADGFGEGCEAPDCDDARADVHPGAAEICGNGRDDDCDPATTDTCPDPCVDGDGDHFGAACAAGPDCDDARADVHPGATEVCGNGRDDDCDPSTSDVCPAPCTDADHDGYGANCAPGPDCDDERPLVHPGAREVCGNGLDDDCDASTTDSCTVTCVGSCGVGCADGQRESFLDQGRFPHLAACAGGFALPGVAVDEASTCGRTAGDDGPNPSGAGCHIEDLCAPGWHVCRTAAEVAAHAPGACANEPFPANTFFAARQSGNGCGQCSLSRDPSEVCTGGSCLTSCYPTSTQTNDVFGCGSVGATPAASCAPLNRFSGNACGTLPSPWSCADSNGVDEALRIVKPGTAGGGALCCND